jgi:hypothetical protein
MIYTSDNTVLFLNSVIATDAGQIMNAEILPTDVNC